MKNIRLVILAFAVLFCMSNAVPQTNIPNLNQRVNDFTNTLSFQEWQEIDHLLKSYEDTASTQMVVLMVNSLEGENIEKYSSKKFNENNIGQALKNKGVLLVIAKQDNKIKIEVGYGLKDVITDDVSSQIIQNEIRPYVTANNYFGGIVTGSDAIIRAAAGDYTINKHDNMKLLMIIIGAAILIIAVAAVIMFLRKKKKSK
jgi:uncharacterized protein